MVTVKRVPTQAGKNLLIAIKDLEGKVGKVGWFENSRYPDAPHVPVAYVATIHEYGYPAKNIPPRPFMRSTIAAKQAEWKTVAESGARAVIEGRFTAMQVMEGIGLKAAGDVRKTISLLQFPPLKPATIAARKAKRSNKEKTGLLTKPLIDTGLMLGTLTNTVENE
jgi:hypothetical protein